MKHILLCFPLTFLAVFFSYAQSEWPKEIPNGDGGKITMYEPQPESYTNNKLIARSAVSIRKTASSEPVFGAIFFTAAMSPKGGKKAELQSLTVTNAKFPGVEDETEIDEISAAIQNDAPKWNLTLSEDEINEAISYENGTAAENFNNAPPKIIYVNRPSTLVVLDGNPRILKDEKLNAEKVVNSPNLIFREGKQWNLYVGGIWYKSNSITGGWKQNTNLSSKVKSVDAQVKKQESENNNGETPTEVPTVTDIIVATEPTELLQTEGEPVYKNVAGTNLLYIENSPNEIFKDINSQNTYVLIAGRWYHSRNMNGPWQYIAADKLPEDFAKIPKGSDKDVVLSNVAGTDAAEEARLDAEIPQTAKVDRRTATVDVQYDGDPIFNRIDGTSLKLAENANLTVMKDASGNYFALDNGVWFIGETAHGPWEVANDRPRDIEDIPASSPAYNSRYVYVYDATPEYVYMGYTSGYLGSYVYGPTIVYGTGYHYRPWYRRMYFPRPITWGFGFMYDPWNGWGINWGFNYGFLHVGFDYGYSAYGYGGYGYGYGYGGGWFGPRRYCPPYRNPYWSGGYYGRYSGSRYYAGGSRYGGRYGYALNNNYVYAQNQQLSNTGRTPRNISSGRAWSGNTNLYNNQRGITTNNITRRPTLSSGFNGTGSLASNTNRFNTNNRTYRLQRGDNQNPVQPGRILNSDAGSNSTNRNNRFRQNTSERRPTVSRPSENSDNTNFPDRRGRALTDRNNPREREQQPDNTDRNVPSVPRPDPSNRPLINNRDRADNVNRQPTERRPVIENQQRQRPQVDRQQVQERPSYNREPVQERRPVIQNHAPAERAQLRQQASEHRPQIQNRPSVPSSPSPRVNSSLEGRRPGR